jgi:FixJ family two-component response regulator
MSSQVVYVIEDDEAVRDSIAMLLWLHGHEVVGYASAEAFLRAGPHARPAVALGAPRPASWVRASPQ